MATQKCISCKKTAKMQSTFNIYVIPLTFMYAYNNFFLNSLLLKNKKNNYKNASWVIAHHLVIS